METATNFATPLSDQAVSADVPPRPVLRTYERKKITFAPGTKSYS